MGNNHQQVSLGFRHLLSAFAPYVALELQNEYGEQWWAEAVMNPLYDEQKRELPDSGDWDTLVGSLDVLNCLTLFADVHWQNIFRRKFSQDHRTWANELKGVRNKFAHLGSDDFTDSNTWRALDTMTRFMEQIDADSTEKIREILRTIRYGSALGSTTRTEVTPAPQKKANGKERGIMSSAPLASLPSWRDVMEPHPDVAQGRYRNAEFAADLAQVARGEGAVEYQDPVEFFGRTFVTDGMAGLLEQALRRVSGNGGEPVIQLKTAFGGGKTHSMLALYHLLGARVSIDKIPVVKPILEKAEVNTLPKTHIAVLVGTALDPTRSKRPATLPGVTINTLWGDVAAQLAMSTGKPDLYDLVKEADKKGVSPGSVALKNLFDAAAPCLILMDELVAYAKKIYGVSGLPAGTFDNFISFIHELTEAARASKNSLVVASIPESVIEIGGEAGQRALETIEHTFGRMESIWKPVASNEGFEVVRRRLFLDCKDPVAREHVCSRFSQMYNENQSEFPVETREVTYKERMVACYPIHPEVFDRLYEDWATLERFQRTRGVLRLMAAVIHELWMNNDASHVIMPGTIPLSSPNVRDELTRHLPEGWNSLVDREVDGERSVPYQKDREISRYANLMASRRVARTIMLGSAPTVRSQAVRGIEASRIRLGVVQPGENIVNFNDALSTLSTALAYLYTNQSRDRFWYDTRPTLRRTASDRATQVTESDVDYEIETRLRKLRKEQPFGGIHICPNTSLDVPDEQVARLVILRPNDQFRMSNENSKAVETATEILNSRGQSPRSYRNMLAFVAPDQDLIVALEQAVREYLAWQSIKEDKEDLNLDVAQIRETENNIRRCHETVEARIKETYCWLIVPYIDRHEDISKIIWDIARISGGSEGIVTKAANKMLQTEGIICQWAPALLRMQLDDVLWNDNNHIAIRQLWDHLCTYCYLPRLAHDQVLMDAIQKGVQATEYFAFASAFDNERYMGLKFNQRLEYVEKSGYLVKIDVAQRQLQEEATQQKMHVDLTGTVTTSGYEIPHSHEAGLGTSNGVDTYGSEERVQSIPSNKRFFMSAQLDTTRIGRDVQKLVEEVTNHLSSIPGAEVKISLEVSVYAPDGIPQTTVRTVMENCKTLNVDSFEFDD